MTSGGTTAKTVDRDMATDANRGAPLQGTVADGARGKGRAGLTVAAAFTEMLLRAASDAGADAEGICADAGIDRAAIGGAEARVPFEAQFLAWEATMRRLRDPGFPISKASRYTTSDFDVVGFACMTRANLGEALWQLARYCRITSDGMGWEIAPGPEVWTATLVMDEAGAEAARDGARRDGLRLGARCLNECVLAEVVKAGRELTGVAWTPREVRFQHAAPRDTSAHGRFFGGAVRFGCAATELVVEAGEMETPLLKADPGLAAFFERHAEALLAQRAEEEEEGLRRRLRTVLIDELRRGLPTLDGAAARLGIGARTLRRRLQEERTAFHEVLDETRRDLAKRYVREQRLPLGEVAFLLGFSEPSAFHRAFKRWTGTTPAAYRSGPGAAA